MGEVVRINGIAAGGDGVGTLTDGRAVFVPRTAPGDLVELRNLVRSKRFARARSARLVEASALRVEPPCPHYGSDECGSCQLQHLSAGAQRSARRRLLGDALRRIGHLDVEDPPLEPSEAEFGYRTKISLTVGREDGGTRSREKKRGPAIGFHPLGRPDDVFDLTRCLLARPELNARWLQLRELRPLLPRNAERIVLRIDRSGGCHVIVKTGGREDGSSRRSDAWTTAKGLGRSLEQAGTPAVLWWEPAGGVARTVYGAPEAYPAMVFEQVHPAMGDRIRSYAIGQLGEVRGGGRHLWDLYAGIGETTELLARQEGRMGGQEMETTVESVERDARAVRVAEQRGPAAGITRYTGRVEDFIPRLRPAAAAIVNPPRTGLGDAGEVAALIAGRPPERLVYVSCDPATLARDLGRLVPGFRLTDLRAFDLFPQTAHVETVATLVRR